MVFKPLHYKQFYDVREGRKKGEILAGSSPRSDIPTKEENLWENSSSWHSMPPRNKVCGDQVFGRDRERDREMDTTQVSKNLLHLFKEV